MCAVRELALEIKGNIFADAEATPQPAEGMHEGIARSWHPYGEETSFGIERAAGIGGEEDCLPIKASFQRGSSHLRV